VAFAHGTSLRVFSEGATAMDGLLFPPLRSQGCDAYQDARRRKLKKCEI